ncbi:hypothetical protein HY256_04645 [Candidatus Sumerlaeota bacterium]|nr:hypothetical protein [Candidatus Sumerlaeota bacterium]
MGYPLQWTTFMQYVYLQFLLINLVASLAFALSLLFNQDAAITMTAMIFLLGGIFTSTITVIYKYVGPLAQNALKVINYTIPQPALYDLSAKVVHGWPAIHTKIILMLTAYTGGFAAVYLGLSFLLFRRRPL